MTDNRNAPFDRLKINPWLETNLLHERCRNDPFGYSSEFATRFSVIKKFRRTYRSRFDNVQMRRIAYRTHVPLARTVDNAQSSDFTE